MPAATVDAAILGTNIPRTKSLGPIWHHFRVLVMRRIWIRRCNMVFRDELESFESCMRVLWYDLQVCGRAAWAHAEHAPGARGARARTAFEESWCSRGSICIRVGDKVTWQPYPRHCGT